MGYNGHLAVCVDLKSHIDKVSFLLGSHLEIEPKRKKKKRFDTEHMAISSLGVRS